ncbi:hypothetical protein PMAYCL1PPCAC_24363 [Pristionchus mayeri]|uniref:MADF domain-containing protein n=1 Tax=Pristionchus mayeri TaxID=1317129 RepID=A0AAN5CZZ9_9BILA|nr:hypothetical protein PMAYCL1PPCAC_24363 [Pristionchus mayeri]
MNIPSPTDTFLDLAVLTRIFPIFISSPHLSPSFSRSILFSPSLSLHQSIFSVLFSPSILISLLFSLLTYHHPLQMAQWTDASRTLLITEFQGRPILWDRRLNDINSRVTKAEALAKVTQTLNETFCPMVTKQQYTVDDVKQQWKNLKDTFVRKQRWVNEGKYLRDPHEEPSWKFYRLLKFLDNTPEDASSPGSPQAGNSNDGMNSRDGHSNSSTTFAFLQSTSMPSTMPLDLDASSSSLHHPSLHPHSHGPPPTPVSSSGVNNVSALLPLSNSLAGIDIKPSTTDFLLQGEAVNQNMINLIAHLRKQGAQMSPRNSLGGHQLCNPASTPLKMTDLEDTDTTTSPSSSRESHDSLTRSIVLPPSANLELRGVPAPLTSFPTTFDTSVNSLSRSMNPSMSVESALKLSGSVGGTEPPSKKRKAYDRLSLMPPLPSSSALLSSSNSPRDYHSLCTTPSATPSAAAAAAMGSPFPPSLAAAAAADAGGSRGSGTMQPFVDNDEYAFFGGFVGSVLRRFHREGQTETLTRMMSGIANIIFEETRNTRTQ